MDPHVPLAVTRRGEIGSAGQPCCEPWAVRGARWLSVNEWGRVVGAAEVSGGEGYDLTQCFELSLRTVEGAPGVGLYVSTGWTSPASARWLPSDEDRASLGALVSHAEALFPPADGEGEVPPLAARSMFFRAAADPREADQPTQFVVVGGRVLLVASKPEGGSLRVSYLDTGMLNAGWAPADAYRPIAVFDMDKDGWPEIVFHESDGSSWADVILRMQSDSTGRPWERVARSVGGSTA